jgi:hypothetical protein
MPPHPEARNTTAFAISLGFPNLPAGICLINAARSSSDLPECTSVMIGPALTAFTRMPREINSPESVLVNEIIAAFVAA